MYLSFAKSFIGLLSSFFLKFGSNILFLSLILSQNNTKGGNNFSHFKLFVYSLMLGKNI